MSDACHFDCLADRSYAATSTTEIVRRAGVSRGANDMFDPAAVHMTAVPTTLANEERTDVADADTFNQLLERIMRIHVTEEARHLSFARHYLKRNVPKLGFARRTAVSIQAPITLGIMASLMLQPPSHLIRRYNVPRDVVKQAYGTPEVYASVAESLRKVRQLCVELGLVTPVTKPMWTALHIWSDDS